MSKTRIYLFASLFFVLIFPFASFGQAQEQPPLAYPPGQWDHIIENQTFAKPLRLDNGDDNTLIINAVFHSIDDHAIMLRNVSNVYIKDCVIYDITGFGILLRGTGSTSNVTIDGCQIFNTSSSGIMASQRWEDGVDHPNLVIKNNTIFDNGLNEHEHNIYVQSTDSLIENNTVYNSSGNGISIRSSGIIRNNVIWGSAKSCIRYYNDHVPGASDTIKIENNTCQLENAGANGSPAISLLESPLSPEDWLAENYIIQGNTVILFTAERYGFMVESAVFESKHIAFYDNRIVNTRNLAKAFSPNYIDYLADNRIFNSVDEMEGKVDAQNSSPLPEPGLNSCWDTSGTLLTRLARCLRESAPALSLTQIVVIFTVIVIVLLLLRPKQKGTSKS